MDNTEYVIYRSGYGELCYLPAKEWRRYVRDTPDTVCVEISRGHTISEAINLTVLANEQQEIEK
jgi:hypothetical protein